MSLHFRHFVAALALVSGGALAHHGWSSFDQDKPLFLSGTVKQVRWQNPHAEVVISVDGAKVPEGLVKRTVPAQQNTVDGAAILAKSSSPANAVGEWEIEFAPLSRMSAWGLEQPLKVGDRIDVVGYGLADGKRTLRVEYLFINGKAYAFRSGPAK